jgi:hypothetical protein
MPETILLVDYENVKDTGLKQLPAHDRVQLFVGKGQRPKITYIEGALGQGTRLDLIQVAEQGRNNLDFYIAFYLGKTLQEEPNARFIVVSNDQDLDPLITHLNKRGLPCARMGTQPAAKKPRASAVPRAEKPVASRPAARKPAVKKAVSIATSGIEEAAAFLNRLGKRRPKTHKTLANALVNHLHKTAAEVTAIIDALDQSRFLTVSKGQVSYL